MHPCGAAAATSLPLPTMADALRLLSKLNGTRNTPGWISFWILFPRLLSARSTPFERRLRIDLSARPIGHALQQLITRIDPLDFLLDRPRQDCEQHAEAGSPDARIARQHEDQKDAACHGEPDGRRQPEASSSHTRHDAEKNAANQIEAVFNASGALQQSTAKLADRITDARQSTKLIASST